MPDPSPQPASGPRPGADLAPAPAPVSARGRVAYLASRHPVVSHTFVDNEILGLEALGCPLVVASLNPPKDEFSHPRLGGMRAPRLYPPPPAVIDELERRARAAGTWPAAQIRRHEAEFGPATKPAQRARHALWLGPALQRLGVVHVHLHFANAATHTALFLRELFGLGFSFTPQARDFLIETGPALLNELCTQARFVVAPCAFAADALIARAPAAAGKVELIFNGIDPAPYPLARPSDTGVRKLLAVGRLVPIKGYATLLRALAAAQAELAETAAQAAKNPAIAKFQLRIIGDGPLRAELEALCRQLGLENAVEFLGQQSLETMRAEMAAADLFVLTAEEDREGGSDMLPTVITEAMFCGLPVLATRLAGIPEQVDDEVTGLLTTPGDEPALARALLRLGTEPGLAARLGEAGLQRAQRHFAQAQTLPKLAAAFRHALDGAPALKTAAAPRPEAEISPSAAAPLLAIYDLDLPKRADWLAAELPALRQRGSRVLCLGQPAAAFLQALDDQDLAHLEWLPDGMVLEMTWAAQPASRAHAASWRRELSHAVDGEILFRAARRAAWIAADPTRPAALFAPGVSETLTLALAREFGTLVPPQAGLTTETSAPRPPSAVPPRLLACLDSAEAWNGQLLRFLAARADHLDDPTGRSRSTKSVADSAALDPVAQDAGQPTASAPSLTSNALLHADPAPRYLKFGPLTTRRDPVPVTPEQRRTALGRWLEAGERKTQVS